MLYKVAQHPDKTFIGWAARGIDFLGFHLASTDLTVAKTAFNLSNVLPGFMSKVRTLFALDKTCDVG